jgi:hypothetical protein
LALEKGFVDVSGNSEVEGHDLRIDISESGCKSLKRICKEGDQMQ